MSDPATPSRPTSAGMYDYYLGGTAHTPADRAAAEQVIRFVPDTVDAVWANRGFLQRAVKRLAGELGVRQFIDIGAGLPTQHNTHDVINEFTSEGRLVYVDVDPAVVAQANRLVADDPGIVVIEGDLRRPEEILHHPETRRLLDFTRPVGLLMVAVLHFVPNTDDPWSLVGRYLAELPSGSYLVLSHGSSDHFTREQVENTLRIYASTDSPPQDRTRAEIERFFQGLEFLPPYEGAEPALSFAGLWGAEDVEAADTEGSRGVYAAVARKP